MIRAKDVARVAVVAVAGVLLAASGAMAEDWAPLWSTTNLPVPRGIHAAASAAGKAFFGGGVPYTTTVDIYDTATGTWSTTNLSQARDSLAAASAGGKVFFAGGSFPPSEESNVVDIYDTATATWSTASLSLARQALAGASAGNKVLFVGGWYGISVGTDRVDIYDTTTGTWSTAHLPVARANLAAASVGSKAFFGTGSTSATGTRVDIYDAATGAWSTTNLSQARGSSSAASAGGKVLFAGGMLSGAVQSSVVDIYDTATGAWSTANLSQARDSLTAASAGGKVFFAGGHYYDGANHGSDRVDIYDTATGAWSTASLSQARTALRATSVGNKVLFAGGYAESGYSSVVDIYTLQTYGTITSAQAFTLVDQTTVAGRMQLNTPGSLNLGTYNLAVGSMSGTAPINLGSRTLTVGNDGTSASYSGAIFGTGGVTKTGGGTQTLAGSNGWTGPTNVSQGVLALSGGLTAAGQQVSIASTAELRTSGTLDRGVNNDGTFTATGALSVSRAFANGGVVHGPGGPNWLTFNNDVTGEGDYTGNVKFSHSFSPGNSAAHVDLENVVFDLPNTLVMEVGGLTPGSQYDQLDVSGLATLGGTLQLSFLDGFAPSLGQEFDLIHGSTTGRFGQVLGLPEGWRLEYPAGGVTLTPEPATLTLLAAGLGVLVARRRKA